MTDNRPIAIAVDIVGGDFAPAEITAGVVHACALDSALTVLAVGPAQIVEPFARAAGPQVIAVPASEIIAMDEHPANAVRAKKDSSIVVGCRLVKEGRAAGFFSAGSTGAAMAAATLVIGRVKGVARPAIATVLPSAGAPVVLLDVGANADCKAEYLFQFALMGSAYANVALGVASPRVALLNIGEEPTKGSMLAQEAHVLMTAGVPGFIGNVEGRDVLTGVADVIVTDGFTGNVALKLLEGTSKVLFGQIKETMTRGFVNKLAAAVLAPSLRALKDRLDPEAYGGAPLLGVDGVCIIGHGSSSATAVANGIAVAARAARGGLTQLTAQAVHSQADAR